MLNMTPIVTGMLIVAGMQAMTLPRSCRQPYREPKGSASKHPRCGCDELAGER